MRKILLLAAALTLTAATRLPAAIECNCTYCQAHPTASCVIHTNFQTGCGSYIANFCVE